MSKKKAFSGNTMTLKDFHGGSIPSDLPLPSAPGVTDRISDRPGYDHRPLPWGVNPTGRTDQRSRVSSSSSSSTRHFEDTTSFLSHAAPIGRNFDEDERKPLDGMPPGPRPTVGDDGGVWASELKHHQQQQTPFSAAGRLSSQHQQVQDVVGSHGNGVPSAAAWSMRKESVNASQPLLQSASSVSTGASKLIHASAIEKVTSGRWHSRLQSTHHQAAYAEETDRGLNATGYYGDEKHTGAIAVVEQRRYERHLINSSSEEIHGKGKDILLDTELAGIHFCSSDEKETNAPMHIGGAFQQGHEEVRVASADPQYPVLTQAFERPKLKLLPRSKPSETADQPHGGHKQALSQVHQKPVDHLHSEFIIEVHGTTQLPVQLAVNESGSQMVERPKLNLKPRSQPLKQSEGIADRERTAVYGGARPRELVLKERRVDEVLLVNSYDLGQSSSDRSKINNNVHKIEGVSASAASARFNMPTVIDQRNGRKVERKESGDDLQRKNCWRNESWKSATTGERQQQQQQERRPSPEIWRKPVEDPKKPPSPPLEKGIRFGKAASAAELAQAFSRSCSVAPNKSPQFSGQRGVVPGEQVPFSRLTGGGGTGGSSGQRAQQINGY